MRVAGLHPLPGHVRKQAAPLSSTPGSCELPLKVHRPARPSLLLLACASEGTALRRLVSTGATQLASADEQGRISIHDMRQADPAASMQVHSPVEMLKDMTELWHRLSATCLLTDTHST